MKIHDSNSLEQTVEIATMWLSALAERVSNSRNENQDGEMTQATLVGLSGHLGAGKTAFVKVLAKSLGVTDEITSPTYVIMKIYDISIDLSLGLGLCTWKRLVHIDAYRLEKYEELEVLNWEQLIADPNNLIVVEWPENAGIDKNKNPELVELKFQIIGGTYNISEL